LSLELRRKGLLASPLTRPDASKAWFWHFLAVAGRVDPRQLSGVKQMLSDRFRDGEF
jgi:hypothetical protein